jgi:hypothetical protein
MSFCNGSGSHCSAAASSSSDDIYPPPLSPSS